MNMHLISLTHIFDELKISYQTENGREVVNKGVTMSMIFSKYIDFEIVKSTLFILSDNMKHLFKV